ncbi:colicin immunity domain-containing protein [Pantoea sp. R13S299]|uniref:colicin immunity domain-containing protein n=1 Tax=Pantoea TaxID=53335 RepID=UPI003AEB9E20
MSTNQSESDVLALIESFVSGTMPAPEFEEKFSNAWREHRDTDTTDKQNKDTQRYFDSVFSAVDSYCSDPDLIDDDDLDAQGLFECVVNLRKAWKESVLA